MQRIFISSCLVGMTILGVAGCDLGTSSPINDEFTADGAAPAEGADAATPSGDPTDSTPAVVVPDPYAADYVIAPAGHCDDPANLFQMTSVIDGDTIELAGGHRVRYIGVDAPEIYENECWSHEARNSLSNLMTEDRVVCLVLDDGSSPVDPYDRWLRYVFNKVGDKWAMQNTRLVRQGDAPAYHAFLNGKDYTFHFNQSEKAAYSDRLAGWDACSWNAPD